MIGHYNESGVVEFIAEVQLGLTYNWKKALCLCVEVDELTPMTPTSLNALQYYQREINQNLFEQDEISGLEISSLSDEHNYVGRAKISVDSLVTYFEDGPDVDIQISIEFLEYSKLEHVLDEGALAPILEKRLDHRIDKSVFSVKSENNYESLLIEPYNIKKTIIKFEEGDDHQHVVVSNEKLIKIFADCWRKLQDVNARDILQIEDKPEDEV